MTGISRGPARASAPRKSSPGTMAVTKNVTAQPSAAGSPSVIA